MPANHLDQQPEFEGRVQFDIERLMTYKSQKDGEKPQVRALMPFVPPKPEHHKPNRDDLKFFDPLRSPDSDMLRLEEELQRKAQEPKVITMPDKRVSIPRGASSKTSKMLPKPPRDIEALISTNLSKLYTKDGQSLKQKADMSKFVFEELGKSIPTPPPGRPPAPKIRKNPFQMLEEHGFVRSSTPDSIISSSTSPKTSRKKSPAPKRPPPMRRANKPRAPKPPVPPQPQPDQLYSQVKKETRSVSSLSSEESLDVPPPSMTAPARPTRPPLIHSESLPAPKPIQVCAEIHSYDEPANDYGSEPKYEYLRSSTRSNSVYSTMTPVLPQRSSSVADSRASFRSYVNAKDVQVGPPTFPPDRKSPLSPPPTGQHPPKVGSLPCRSMSVASSIKSRSALYASVASERGYASAAMSSLNHSYETLNVGSEPAAQQEPEPEPEDEPEITVEQEEAYLAQRRKPHRPAPPVPVKEQFERSKEILFNNPKDVDPITGRRLLANRTEPGNQRNMRYRKMHSVKRQIQIKEKMLEVTYTLVRAFIYRGGLISNVFFFFYSYYLRLNRGI